MRARKKKHGDERFEALRGIASEIKNLDASSCEGPVIYPDKELPGFNKMCLEIGCGKGSFIIGTAQREPETGFIAMERIRDILVTAMEKANGGEIGNVRFLCADAQYVGNIFPERCFDRIYINFCDPWPKKRHAKRRLTSKGFLGIFKPLLKDGGYIAFKTDNRALFDFSLEEFDVAGYRTENVCFDLHEHGNPEYNVMTEYEKAFVSRGVKINRLEAFPEK